MEANDTSHQRILGISHVISPPSRHDSRDSSINPQAPV